MRIVSYDQLFEEPVGRLFAPWNGHVFGAVWVLGERGPRGELMVRDLFPADNDALDLLADGHHASVRARGFAWLQKDPGLERFVVFEVADAEAALPALQRAASGAEVEYVGGSLDGQVHWFAGDLTERIVSDDRVLGARDTYVRTGRITSEGYQVYQRVSPRTGER